MIASKSKYFYPKNIGSYALAIAIMVVGLVAYGAWVRVSGSGLGCPDWPLCEGGVVPSNIAALIESGHRWYAGIVMLCIFGLTLVTRKFKNQFPIGSKMAIGASVAVIIQALLGAIVVFTELNPLVRLVHLLLAMTIILLLAITAFDFLSDIHYRKFFTGRARHLLITSAAIILLGSSIVARKYSFSCIGIPLCGDIGIPEATILHDSHRTLAYILLLGTFFMTFKMWRANIRGIELNLSILCSLIAFSQICLGLSAVFFGMPDILRILHAGVASLLWLSYVSLWAITSDLDTKKR
ncbi:MAG: COX15/CtaA family protein [SAR202 cluster bacterium]|nr:COX15/CtaA family protein [SAR202 cluster bacterium]